MLVAHPQSPPRLADHVRACRCGDQLIFLDLQRSKYIAVGGPRLEALSEIILGRAAGEPAPTSLSESTSVSIWIKRLIEHHLLSSAPSTSARRQPSLLDPVATLDTDDERSAVDWAQLLRLWRSTWIASAWLRRHSLSEISDRVVALRARHARRNRGLDKEAMRCAVGHYLRLRPFAQSTHDKCLKDSLTLVHFLAGQGLFPQWVIGVNVHPFAAHSWVQHADVVLNEQPERVLAFKPILIV